MTAVFVIWSTICLLIAVVWRRRYVQLGRVVRENAALYDGMFDAPPTPAPRVSVIVAAKDEEAGIEACVSSLLRQDYPNFNLIVADDRSTDHTGAILDRLAEQSGDRLRVLHIKELPAGWFGKAHAVHRAFGLADGELLLFTDADCEFTSRRAISTAVRFAAENDVEFLSVIPRLVPSCLAESLLHPVCTGILMIWHHPRRVNNPKRREAYANGAFMLLRREAYHRIGGHERVRDALCEDMQLARAAKSSGVRLHIIQNRDLYFTRMYTSFAAVWRGWSRIFGGGLRGPGHLLLAVAVLFVFSILPALTVSFAAVSLLLGGGQDRVLLWVLMGTGGAAWSLMQLVMAKFYAMLETSRIRSLLYVPAAMICEGILLTAMFRALGLGTTTWRGTVYQHAKSPPPVEPVIEKPAHAR